MNKENILKFLIPVVAVVVILESVVIVTGMVNKGKSKTSEIVGETGVVQQQTKVTVNPKDAYADLVFEVDNKSMQIGKKYTLALSSFPKKDFAIDAMDIYIRYDASAFDLDGLTFGDTGLGKPAASKISKDKGMVVVNYWISDPKGFSFSSGKLVSLLSVNVKPKKSGQFDFEIATGDSSGNSASMLVEKTTAKVLPFVSNKLTVNVTN